MPILWGFILRTGDIVKSWEYRKFMTFPCLHMHFLSNTDYKLKFLIKH